MLLRDQSCRMAPQPNAHVVYNCERQSVRRACAARAAAPRALRCRALLACCLRLARCLRCTHQLRRPVNNNARPPTGCVDIRRRRPLHSFPPYPGLWSSCINCITSRRPFGPEPHLVVATHALGTIKSAGTLWVIIPGHRCIPSTPPCDGDKFQCGIPDCPCKCELAKGSQLVASGPVEESWGDGRGQGPRAFF